MDSPAPRTKVLDTIADHVLEMDHVAIAVTNLEDAVTWYGGLGFKVLERRVTRGERTSMRSAVLKAGRSVVVLIQGVEPDSQVSRFVEHFGPGVQHLAFAVGDLDAALAAVRSAGGDIATPIIQDEGIRQAFLRRDPGSGVRIELIERRGGSFTDRSVEQLFRAFERQDLY
jgi:catechol 2,3-dioxygenase-like lactoylglutathione lyase family enzyme